MTKRPRRLLGKYRLEGREPVYVEDLIEWCEWFEHADEARRVARTTIGQAEVSTVFLGIDHNWGADGPPILFETMIFVGKDGGVEDYQERYATWAEAEEGHARAVAFVREAIRMEKVKP